jgi:tetratricopeptide (TPR) repeat protein
VARELIAYEPNEPGNYQLLARLYEDQGDYEQAEAMFHKAIEVNPNAPLGHQLLAAYHNRQGEFDKTMAAYQRRAELEPNNPEAWHTIGHYYYEKVYRDTSVSREQGLAYLQTGLEAENKALAINPDYYEALIYKSLTLALQANKERSPALQKQLLDEANQLRDRALEIQAKQGSTVAN